MATNNSNMLHWRLTSEKPVAGSRIIAETLDGAYIEETISSDEIFDEWGDSIIRWAFSPHWLNIERKANFSDKMNPPKNDKKEEENDKKYQEDIVDAMFYGSLLWFLLSKDDNGDAKCRKCCCDGLNDSQDDKMDELRSWLLKSDFNKDEDKRTCDESVSDETRYKSIRNGFFYCHAGKGSYRRKDAIKDTLEHYPELEGEARKIDPWYFIYY